MIHRNKRLNIKKIAISRLPADVESVVDGYTFRSTSDDIDVRLQGKRIIRRGVKFLGVRSNVVKSNYFSDINGAWRFGGKHIEFSAGEGEWNLSLEEPLILRDKVHIMLDGKSLEADRMAEITFKKGVIKTYGEHGKLYSFEKTAD